MAHLQNLSWFVSIALWTLSSAKEGISSRLQVHIPQTLMRLDGYEHREALFGIPPYGGKITQLVYYADDDLCESVVDTHKGYPVRPEAEDGSGKMMPWPSPYILMVDRGTCTFVTKVRNAQRNGAAGVIIADNSCLCSATECKSEPGVSCEQREPIMADDGSGRDISIPAFLMFKQDSDVLIANLKENEILQVEMAWSLPAPDDRAEYDLWSVPTDEHDKDFITSFKAAAVALGKRAYFTPHQYLYDGVQTNCVDDKGGNQCYNLCTNSGRYCATDPDGDLKRGISGADVVVESLRRICIWKHYGVEDGVGVEWWDYVNEFAKHCSDPDLFNSTACIKGIMEKVFIDIEVIKKCMADSGGTVDNKPNSLLDIEIRAKENVGVVILPATYVNKAAIRGALEFVTIFKAVCAGYAAGTEPEVCLTCVPCADSKGCVSNGICNTSATGDTVSQTHFIGSMLGLSCFFLLVVLFQYQRTQRQMRSQVRGIVAEYMPLDNEAGKMDTEIS